MVNVQIKNGTMLIIPSYSQHSVPPDQSGQERVRISLSIMFASFAQNMGKPMW